MWWEIPDEDAGFYDPEQRISPSPSADDDETLPF